ncbi:iron ABC transporter substrate-binding protein [Couchioplanes caeruleus subsp. caeruleus]|uniref:Iron ABC transporter substrate-binding protein n=1 Tax=Couchioplanes caeruleus subsp. caeruleus TaxID=56427 RepID=A0A1K0FT59_9ACTN|nr:iron ABC transporter substrate-binding protein [Couchioplanes caeruleus subsp. caeruleus]
MTTVALVSALALTACGGANAESKSGGATGASGAFPVSIEHKHGTAEIKAEPQRVVTLGLSDQDAVLALGVKPVGVVDWFKEKPYGKWPWAQPLWGDTKPEIVGERDEYNLEKIASLKPDLIIAQYSGMKKEQYDKLSQLAPVVGQPKKFEDYQAPWQDMTRAIGKALGKEAKANELIDAVGKRFAEARKAHPEFAGKTTAVAEVYQAGTYSVFSPNDPKMLFLAELGFTVTPKFREAVGTKNVADFSFERLDIVEADRLFWLVADDAAAKQIKEDKLYSKLKVAQEGRDVYLPYETPPVGAAMAFNTVLSIPYAIDQVVPMLTAKK